jgi:hypothetical protein
MRASAFQRTIASVATAAFLCLAATTTQAKPSGSWRLTFDSQTEVDGVIGLRITPAEGTPIDVEVKIPARTTENQVADLVSDALKQALGSKNFRVGVDDGESVVIKRRGKTKNFEVTMRSPPITGLGVKLKHN